jgi:hypothetical protein
MQIGVSFNGNREFRAEQSKSEYIEKEKVESSLKRRKAKRSKTKNQSCSTLLKTTFFVLGCSEWLKTCTQEAEVHRENATYNCP